MSVEQAHHFFVSAHRRVVQGRPALLVSGVHMRAHCNILVNTPVQGVIVVFHDRGPSWRLLAVVVGMLDFDELVAVMKNESV